MNNPVIKLFKKEEAPKGVKKAWKPTMEDVKTLKRLIDKVEFTGDTEEEGRNLLAKMKKAAR